MGSAQRFALLAVVTLLASVAWTVPGQAAGGKLVTASQTRVNFGSWPLNSYVNGTPVFVSANSGYVQIASSSFPANPPFYPLQDSCTGSVIGPGPTGYACTITIDFYDYEPAISSGHYRGKVILYDTNGHALVTITYTGVAQRP